MRNKTKKTSRSSAWLVFWLVMIAVVMVWIVVSALVGPDVSVPPVTDAPGTTGSVALTTTPAVTETPEPVFPMDLGNGLVLLQAGGYNGMYMEDGSNRIVSDVFMIGICNDADADLQYGQIVLTVEEQEYSFKVTNLPAGATAVVLEEHCSLKPEFLPLEAEVRDLVWFTEPMSASEDVFRITGQKGVVNVKNISDQPMDGVIYVYYKYKADDIYFGGITFRVKIENGLAAGEIRQVPSGHFDPDSCEVVNVTVYES